MDKIIKVMDIAELPSQEMLSILRQGSMLRLPHLEGRLRQATEQVNRFEAVYGITLEKLMAQGLPDDANYQAHEDFIEWEYWQDVISETDNIIKNVKRILKKADEASALH